MRRERALKIVLVVVGLLFTAMVYPLVLFVKQEPALAMQFSVYVTLGIFLLFASRTSFIRRQTLAREIPCFLATCVSDIPERRSVITCCRSTSSRARPICRPSSLALRIPAFTRSMMMQRSNSAIADTITRIALPSGPSVSIASRCERNWIPMPLSSSMVCNKCLVDPIEAVVPCRIEALGSCAQKIMRRACTVVFKRRTLSES